MAATIDARIPPTIVQPAIASAERRNAAELDVRFEALPPALSADGVLRRVGEHRGDLCATQSRLVFGRHGDVLRHAAPERAVADVDRGEEREADEREHRDDDEDHEPRRDDHLVDPAPLEGAACG